MAVAVTGERLAAAQCVHSSLPGAHTKWETVTYSHCCDLGKVYISSLCSFLGNSKRYIWLKQSILSRLACSGTWFTVLSLSHLFTQALFSPPTSHSPEAQSLSLPSSTRLSFLLHIEHRNPRLPSQAPFSPCLHPCVATSPLIPSCFLVAMRLEFLLLNDLHHKDTRFSPLRDVTLSLILPLFSLLSFWPNRS